MGNQKEAELKQALWRICQCCQDGNCSECEIYGLRLRWKNDFEDNQWGLSAHVPDLPESFAFQTKANRWTRDAVYHAQKTGQEYIVTLPYVGEICVFSVEKMRSNILKHKFVIVQERAEVPPDNSIVK